ncbi:MAG: ATP-binding protein, partial [Pseudomonadota bacterium]
PNPSRRTATLSGVPFLYLSTSELPNGWSLHYFTLDDQAVTRAWLATGAGLLLGGILVIAFQVRRVQRIGLALRRSEDEEAQLRAANERLAVEIEERRNAERTLKKTQTELERAGRLAALGTLASSVTHELGQPIAAMRNHLVAAELQAGSTALTQKMQGLVARMEDITRQLKFFSRKGRDRFETIDLADAMQASLDLLEPHIDATQAQVRFDRPDHPVSLYANKLRMEQVMTNLIRNALDAVDGRVEQQVIVTMGRSGEGVWFEVADTGHGLGDLTLEDLREPFATTRESGQGMGLGLTISAGIVTDHQGVMTAQNRPGGGATFRVAFAGERAVA